jgi:hypothetical protein
LNAELPQRCAPAIGRPTVSKRHGVQRLESIVRIFSDVAASIVP